MARARFNLLALPSNLVDSTSFYRCMGPLHALRRQRPSLNTTVFDNIHWTSLSEIDAVMFQRPTNDNQLKIARMAAQHGLPIWVEYDDNFFALPRDNPHHDSFMNVEVHRVIVQICSVADVVTVTTEALAAVFRQFCPPDRVRVVPNAMMTNIVGPVRSTVPITNPIVMWRGTNTHIRDVEMFTPEIIAAAEKHPGWRWMFQGFAPYRALEAIGKERASSGKMQDQLTYFATLAAVNPSVFIVPLADHAFNRCKSNIAALEAFYAGAVPVVPDWLEWRIPGALTYTDNASFAVALDHALTMTEGERADRWSKGAKFVRENLSIDVVNSLRANIVDHLEKLSWNEAARSEKRALVAPQLVLAPIKSADPAVEPVSA